jgi:uncharacterized membrane protein YfcA
MELDIILIFVALSGIAAGIVKGVSGFGSSLVTIPLLTLIYGQDFIPEIIVMMITFNVILNTVLLVENKGFHPESLRRVWLIPVFGVLFTFVGIQILLHVEAVIISYIAGGLILIAIINKAFHLHLSIKDTPLVRSIVGALSGIGNGIASIDGPPVVFYLTSIDAKKKEFINVLAAHFLVMGVVAVVIHLFEGSYSVDILFLTLFVLVFALIGLFIGIRVRNYLNQATFDKVILVILVGLAISLFI